MRHPYLTDKAVAKIEEGFQLNRTAWQLLALVVAEWENDPTSVQCFDLRIVERAKEAVKRRREIDEYDWAPMLRE